MSPGIVLAGIALAALLWLAFYLRRRHRRARLFRRPVPAPWLDILDQWVPFHAGMPPDLRARLHGHIQVFLHDKVFLGCDGQEIDDLVRLTIAGNACMLVLNREPPAFPAFQTVLVYPDTYLAAEVIYDGLVEIHSETARLGESWHRGPVVLSWADVVQGVQSGGEAGHNVVLHEFAHKLDEENLDMDGLPVLRESNHYREWARVLSEEFTAFRHRVASDEDDIIDSYGAESAAEFFAVITETFFCRPAEMKRRLPELYGQLSQFYQIDPASWVS